MCGPMMDCQHVQGAPFTQSQLGDGWMEDGWKDPQRLIYTTNS